MARLIISADTNSVCEASIDTDGRLTLSTVGKSLGEIPTLYDKNGGFVSIVNSWFYDLKAVRALEDLNSYSRALLSYWSFLEEQQLSWDYFTPVKRLKPTYLYRHYLLTKVKSSSLALSTANHYINHVVHFYTWAIQEGYLRLNNEHEAPFTLQYINLSRYDKFTHIPSSFQVHTTDLRIKVFKDADTQIISSMNPLGHDALKHMAIQLNEGPTEFRLQCLLAVQCGLRISEVCSFTVDALRHASPTTALKTRYQMTIGPAYGIQTKFGKERHIEIPAHLLRELQNYSISERRLRRLAKLTRKVALVNSGDIHLPPSKKYKIIRTLQHEPLFISEQGNPVDSGVTSVRWAEFREKIRLRVPVFKHTFHDLRCTYGTYRLSDLLDAGLPSGEALDCLMGWMGHKHEQTTWKYLRYLKRQDVLKAKFALLDAIMFDAVKGATE
ncbi:tyrosine-type recombinase/integrase [Enterobacter sp. WCHEn045836]|uniref:tyrosine-type recombinase/integrase n=1 Tax=Enterobacter sp. WCHEn045836 TaxID=2497434 RepID=UPI00163A1627|nr:site-specific integrase [Enterobacter sp. WCHEn045836]